MIEVSKGDFEALRLGFSHEGWVDFPAMPGETFKVTCGDEKADVVVIRRECVEGGAIVQIKKSETAIDMFRASEGREC